MPKGVISLDKRSRSLWSGVLLYEAGCSRFVCRRSRGGSYVPGTPQTIPALSGEAAADQPIRGKKGRETSLPPAFRVRRCLSHLGSRVLCALVGLSLVLSLLVGPRVAYAAWVPLGDFEVTAAMLEAAFGWVAAGLTGVTAGAVGAVGGAAVLGGYSLWASENPEDAAEFEQYLAENIVSQDVGGNQQLAMNLQAMPSSLKDSIIDYVASGASVVGKKPVIPSGSYSYTVAGLPYTGLRVDNKTFYWSAENASAYLALNPNYNLDRVFFFSSNYSDRINGTYYYTMLAAHVVDEGLTVTNGNYVTVSNNTSETKYVYKCQMYNTETGGINFYGQQVLEIAPGKSQDFSGGAYRFFNGIDLGAGFETVPVYSGVSSGLSGAFDSLVAGTGTATDVAVAGGVEAVYLPNVAINGSTVTVDDAYDASGVIYPDIAITIDGGGGGDTVPIPEDALTALQQIIGLLTPMGIITGIPPIVQDIDTKMGAIIDTWPGVMDILDGLGLLPPIVQDIADGMGVIIDIPQSLEDITDILLPIPQSLQGLLDGVTIDIPQTLAQILNGTISIPTAIDGVISGVAALPAAIAGALDIDWVLENTEELKERLPNLDAPLILPQASFDDLKDVANDYKERTPLGKIFEAYEGTFDVMSTSPQGAPRYEITFPSPINYTFVIDFSVFDGLFVQLAHAFFYLLAIFWYLKFLKSVKGWVDSWLTFDGKFFHVAGEEAGASWE